MNIDPATEFIGKLIEIAGVGILVLGAVLATIAFLLEWLREGLDKAYDEYRANLGRAILLGLEFLVIGDIIRTVAIEMTFTNLGTLAIIVLIRTFLSFALEIEITGSLPWRTARGRSVGGQGPPSSA